MTGVQTCALPISVGGTTTIMDFAPQDKDVPLLEAIRRQAAKAENVACVDYGFHGIIMDPKVLTL